MEIVGGGFLARHLRPDADRFPDVTVLAAGVSRIRSVPESEFERERDLVRSVAARCRRDGRQLVFLSTSTYAMYGSCSRPAAEDEPVSPETPYGQHKRELELEVAESVPAWLVLRLTHVVGGDQPDWHLLPSLVEQFRSGVVTVHGGAYRDLIDVEDVRAILAGLLDARTNREVVNVASGTPFAVESIVDCVERRLGKTVPREVVPGGSGKTLVSIAKLRRRAPGPSAGLGGDQYLNRLVDRYVPCYAGAGDGPGQRGEA
ncbi:NAD-dependent epimerase/dehydratase family protein [Amycolatopsis circi]|uniref:NAD-dependent epimerase/dehydratase family protein n=1 Tax=Amycolatopsis circi TaxID=871959 RepID=UPI000E26ABC2|nr:NAD(P)-dependent oxidoreductase [Amycolatopsis circi]